MSKEKLAVSYVIKVGGMYVQHEGFNELRLTRYLEDAKTFSVEDSGMPTLMTIGRLERISGFGFEPKLIKVEETIVVKEKDVEVTYEDMVEHKRKHHESFMKPKKLEIYDDESMEDDSK